MYLKIWKSVSEKFLSQKSGINSGRVWTQASFSDRDTPIMPNVGWSLAVLLDQLQVKESRLAIGS